MTEELLLSLKQFAKHCIGIACDIYERKWTPGVEPDKAIFDPRACFISKEEDAFTVSPLPDEIVCAVMNSKQGRAWLIEQATEFVNNGSATAALVVNEASMLEQRFTPDRSIDEIRGNDVHYAEGKVNVIIAMLVIPGAQHLFVQKLIDGKREGDVFDLEPISSTPPTRH